MKFHLKEHQNNLRRVIKSLSIDKGNMVNLIGITFTLLLLKRIYKEQYKHRMLSLQTKNKKLKRLIDLKVNNSNINNFSVPVINLSSHVLTEKEHNHLKYGLKFCFIDRNKNVKKHLSAELETLAQQTSDCLEPEKLEEYHEFLRAYADIFSSSTYNSKDYIYHDLKSLIKNKDIKVLQGDKDSSVIIMDSKKYYEKLETRVNEGIYKETIDTTLHDLKLFQDFLYRNFKDYKDYEKMRPFSNRPARLYAFAKTHKFDNINDVNLDQLKFRPIMDQTGTDTYNAAQVISNYLKPLCTNEYNIKDTLQFPQLLKDLLPLKDDKNMFPMTLSLYLRISR